MIQYPNMFKPLTIKNTTFKNRVFASPVTTDRIVVNGCPTQECINAYENRARGGFAAVTVTETFIDFDRAARHDHSLDIVSPHLTVHHIESIVVLVEAIKVHGAVASIQLNHVGNANHPSIIKDGKNPIGPISFVREDGIVVDEMDEDMMMEVANNYANAVAAAKDFGFDMVMIHGGHGWLLAQFLSPLTNKRKDKYGGTLENRTRFPLMVLDEIRKKVGTDFLIEYRMSGDERVPGGLKIDEAAEFAAMIQDKVDLIHVISGLYHNHVQSKAFSSMFDPHGCNLDLAAAIKNKVHIPVVAVGGFNHLQQIEDAITSGKCDFVALGRQQFADPEFVNKALTGRTDEIAPCLRCSCFNPLAPDPNKRPIMKPFQCTVNPKSCRELRLQYAPKPISSKNVVVIDGGPGGMYAAITVAERGHKVTLKEKNSQLGGLLWFTDYDCHKDDLRRYKESLKVRLKRLGVKVELNTEATFELLKDKKPDAVICAVGSEPIVPKINGIENAKHALFVYEEPKKVGKRVIMIGGGLVGCEIGYHLAEKGHDVLIVEMFDDIARDAYPSHKEALMLILEKSLRIRTGVVCTRIYPNGIIVKDKDGKEIFYEADTVVYAVGMKPKKDVVESLRSSVAMFRAIGDCVKPAKVLEAVRDGMFAAMDIL
ncbi:2,4-dienoyl-CoA reductase [Caloramator quimbayensis]|uniref:2,4-dienoyl-CoA reductase n=1 Tax=Caloramator quimbayensis TaxID=1147123 RepID=A0A1T4Y810_9CLOT|nr:FAD-dependent oxidoreductase [Caloramator quimbayensis]SKA97974.1 2,4-dienoyl-CoA reductase [Caloramator quimbayensis]